MKKTVLVLLVTFFLGNALRLFLPWWSIVPAAAVAGWIWPSAGKAFLGALLGGILLWAGYAFWADQANTGILSARIGQLFKGLNGTELILISGLLGGLLAGCGAWTAALLRGLAKTKP